MPDLSVALAMGLFAITTSASPGPVNIVCAMTGARHGVARALPFVTGATLCFVAQLVGLGTGTIAGVGWVERVSAPLSWLGAAYLLWLAWRLAGAPAPAMESDAAGRPSFWDGVVIQGLNPKAWLVVVSALATFVLPLDNRAGGLALFAGLYLAICWLSLAGWVVMGAQIPPAYGRLFNRAMALLLVASVLWMLATG